MPCSSRGRVSARVRARARVRVRARVKARARARKSAIARRGWWRWVLCGGMGGGFGCYVVGEWCMGGGMVLCR